jgi:FkbM family methyltransferase
MTSKKITPISDTFSFDDKIIIVDVGCRWGFAERFLDEAYQKRFKIFGFDPDQLECDRLQLSYSHLPDGCVTCVPIGLAGMPGIRNLYLTKEPACSSLHAPIRFLAENYPALDCISMDEVVTTKVTTLDLWACENDLQSIDYIKIDTQGSELEILKGGEGILNTARCIDIEVEFNPIYEGQSLFAETDAFLRSKGFVLWRLSNLVHYSLGGELLPIQDINSVCFDVNVRQESQAFGGQLFWADARYINRDVLCARKVDSERYMRDSILFESLKMIDVKDHMSRISF